MDRIKPSYVGRLAPSPTGYLHAGHLATFRVAWERAKRAHGSLILRIEDIDPERCQERYEKAALEDLKRMGLDWDEGPDVGGSRHPYHQSQGLSHYRKALETLIRGGHIYASDVSRAKLSQEKQNVSPYNGEVIFPESLRETAVIAMVENINLRFRVPDGRVIVFEDGRMGRVAFTAGKDFGDFLVWRRNGWPAYEHAVVVDDLRMGITEIVRGEDLLLSTARQILVAEALGQSLPPTWHTPLIRDEQGNKLSKREKARPFRGEVKRYS